MARCSYYDGEMGSLGVGCDDCGQKSVFSTDGCTGLMARGKGGGVHLRGEGGGPLEIHRGLRLSRPGNNTHVYAALLPCPSCKSRQGKAQRLWLKGAWR